MVRKTMRKGGVPLAGRTSGRDRVGRSVSIAEAKAKMSELVSQVEGGETVEITHRGTPVAVMSPAPAPRKPFDLAALRALTASMPFQDVDAGTFVRQMRDEDRY